MFYKYGQNSDRINQCKVIEILKENRILQGEGWAKTYIQVKKQLIK